MFRRNKNKSKEEKMAENTEEEKVETTDESMQGTETSAEVEAGTEEVVVDELTEMQNKYDEVNDKFLRLYSEFENFRRRTAKEKLDLMSNAQGEALKTLLPIVDDFDRAIANNDDAADFAALRDGFKLIHQKLNTVLSQKGVQVMDVEKGSDFNVDLHEAITQIPAPEDSLKGKVVDVVEKGYQINEKVLRYAKVVVGS